MRRYYCLMATVLVLVLLLGQGQAWAQEKGNAAGLPELPQTSVQIPWNQMRALLEQAGERRKAPPVEYVFSPASYAIKTSGERAAVSLSCDVTTLSDGYTLVPLGPAEQGVTSAKVGGEECPLVVRENVLYALLAEKGKHKLAVELEVPVREKHGVRELQIALVASPVASVSAAISGGPALVETNGAVSAKIEAKDGVMLVSAVYRGGMTARLLWRAKSVADKPARQNVATDTLVSVEPGQLVCRAHLRYEALDAGLETLRIALPEDVEFRRAEGDALREAKVVNEGKRRFVVVTLKEVVLDEYRLVLDYARRFKETERSVAVPLVAHPDAEAEAGSVAVEVRGNYELSPAAKGLERIDVKELPAVLWEAARSPLLLAYRYSMPPGELSLALTRHQDLDVLVAMSDVCEASTVITPDGKQVTKLMLVVRNNLKPFLTLKLPQGAQVWSALVADRPVTPAKNSQGEVLIPLRKSEDVDEHDEDSYSARRDRRREGSGDGRVVERAKRLEKERDVREPRDLKPFDVELVLVGPKVELAERGEVAAALPQFDVPIGHLAWAVFLPKNLRVVDAAGNVQEVRSFTLPFRHFGEAEHLRQLASQQEKLLEKAEAQQKADEALKKIDKLASRALAEGVLPVRIEIPITGDLQRFEKFLVVDESPRVAISYRRAD
jgi:hypothetical protein